MVNTFDPLVVTLVDPVLICTIKQNKMKMILEVIALINDMNKLINDKDQRLYIGRQKFCPPNVIGAFNQGMFTSMKEVDCSKLVIGTE